MTKQSIQELEAALAVADAEFRAANAALEMMGRQWTTADRLVRTATYDTDPLLLAKAQRDLGIVERGREMVERRVRDAALARNEAEQQLSAVRRKLRIARENLDWLATATVDHLAQYHKSDLQRIERQANDIIRRLG